VRARARIDRLEAARAEHSDYIQFPELLMAYLGEGEAAKAARARLKGRKVEPKLDKLLADVLAAPPTDTTL